MIKRKSLLFFFVFIFGVGLSRAQIGEMFPDIETRRLSDDSVVTLPKDGLGKYTLVGLAYGKKAGKDLKSWYGPVYRTFIQQPEPGNLFVFAHDVNVFFIPMFTGFNKLGYGKAKKEMLKKTDPKIHKNALLYKGSLGDYKDALHLKSKKKPYFFVLDENGKIVYATEGAYSDTKLNEIENLLP